MRKIPDFITRVSNIRREIRDIKLSQKMSSRNIPFVVNESGNAYDGSVAVPGLSGTGTISLNFSPDSGRIEAVDYVYELYRDGLSSADLVLPDDSNLEHVFLVFRREFITSVDEDVTIKIINQDFTSHTYYLKLYVLSSSTGLIS